MKLMIASDIHGSRSSCEKLLDAYRREQADKLLLLGDLLYHGPRNDLPPDYAPKKVIALLNEMKNDLLCVRGNCEAEVDQMVLDFPVMADYAVLFLDEHMVFATHGHIYHENALPPLKNGDILLHGHTHIPALKQNGTYFYCNPGSVSIPKDGNVPSYLIYEHECFILKDMDGNSLDTLWIKKEE